MLALKSTNGPMVSVVIPAFNAARTIGRSVESVAAQTFKNLEIIVVDDGSTDDLDGALAPFKDVALHIVRHRVNRGAAAARNTGVEAARGDYLAFLDADDAWFADKLEAQVACLEQMREPVKLCCVGYVLRRDGRSADETILLEGFSKTKQFDALLLGCNLSPGSTLVLPRASFEAIGPFDERMRRLEDWDWLLRFATRGRIAIVRRPLTRIHVTGRPRRDHTLDALQRMRARYLSGGAILRASQRRRFRSALLLETAAVYYRSGELGRSTFYLASSLAVFPWRNRAFFRHLGRHLLHRVAPRRTPAVAGQVVHVISGLGVGGAERTLAALVLAKSRAEPPPIVVSLTAGGLFAGKLAEAGVQVVSLKMRRGLPNPLAIVHLARVFRRTRPEVVQSWMYHADLVSLLALVLSGRRRRTLLCWGVRCSAMDGRRYRLQLRLTIRLCAAWSRFPDIVIANSQAGREAHRRIGYAAKRFEVIENGIDAAAFQTPEPVRGEVRAELGIPPDAPVVISVARVDPMKDYESFLAALRRLDGVHAIAVGHGTQDLPAMPTLHRLGQRRDIARLLVASDVLASSSAFGEGFSNAIAEAMAAGLPVVATDVGDARRIMGDAGVIVPPRDPERLAAALCELLEDPQQRRLCGARGCARIQSEFSFARMMNRFDAAYGLRQGAVPSI